MLLLGLWELGALELALLLGLWRRGALQLALLLGFWRYGALAARRLGSRYPVKT